MTELKFNPQIFAIEIPDNNNTFTVNLLTVDGETPTDTLYFLDNPSAISSNLFPVLDAKMESEDWEQMSLENSDLELSDFDIDPEVFNQSGYKEVYAELKTALADVDNQILKSK